MHVAPGGVTILTVVIEWNYLQLQVLSAVQYRARPSVSLTRPSRVLDHLVLQAKSKAPNVHSLRNQSPIFTAFRQALEP